MKALASVALVASSLVPARAAQDVAPAAPSSQARMVAELARIAEQSDRVHEYFSRAPIEQLARQVEGLRRTGPKGALWQRLVMLGQYELRVGDEDAAIEHLSEARALLPDVPVDDASRLYSIFQLGVACLRRGETRNCCARNAPESCIFPLRGAAIHTDREGSEAAVECFATVLGQSAAIPELQRSARWLLNLAHMTLGEYPDGVPEAWRLPPDAFESEVRFPRFVNRAAELGLSSFSMCGGAVVDDLDGDGALDVLVSDWDTRAELRFLRNARDGTFVDRSAATGLAGITGGLNLVPGDYDGDGRLDVLVLRGAWLKAGGRHPNSLLRNEGGGRFRDVTFEAGLGAVHHPTQTAAFADYDNDGDLDLYVGNESSPELEAPCQLFRNAGDGTFVDVAAAAGVQNGGYTKGVAFGDYDGDRLPDLYVSNLSGPNRLYRNRGDGTFEDVAPRLGVTLPLRSFPTWFFDYDNDGHLDLFVGSYTGRIGEVAAHVLGLPHSAEPGRLYRNDGAGGFEDVTAGVGLDVPMLPMGSNFGDLDNDGFLDVYLGTGDPDYASLMPNLLFWNRGGERFVDVTVPSGLGHLQKGHAVAFADLDGDGDLDVFEQMGGAFPGDRYGDALYENPGFGNRWLAVELVGTTSNRLGVGARLRAEIEERGAVRSVYRTVGSGGSFGASPLRQTLGLGAAEVVRALEVRWPTSGTTQVFRDVAAGQRVRIVEGRDALERLELAERPFRAR